MTSKVYVFTRIDLPPAQITVQSVHSAIVLASHLKIDPDKHPSVITIRIKNLLDLNKAFDHINGLNIKNFPFFEPLFDNELTSFCTEILEPEKQKLLKKYQLIKHSDYKEGLK